MKTKFYPFTICFEEGTNCDFDLGQEIELAKGDTFEKQFNKNYPPIKYEVVSTTDGVFLKVREVKE